MTSRSVEIATIEVTVHGCKITTANGESHTAHPGDIVRLNYQFEQDFLDVLEELEKKKPRLP